MLSALVSEHETAFRCKVTKSQTYVSSTVCIAKITENTRPPLSVFQRKGTVKKPVVHTCLQLVLCNCKYWEEWFSNSSTSLAILAGSCTPRLSTLPDSHPYARRQLSARLLLPRDRQQPLQATTRTDIPSLTSATPGHSHTRFLLIPMYASRLAWLWWMALPVLTRRFLR